MRKNGPEAASVNWGGQTPHDGVPQLADAATKQRPTTTTTIHGTKTSTNQPKRAKNGSTMEVVIDGGGRGRKVPTLEEEGEGGRRRRRGRGWAGLFVT